MKSKVELAFERLEDLSAQYIELGEKVSKAQEIWKKLAEEQNKDKYLDIDWLISNPDEPGQYENLQKYMEIHYGGVYNGVHASGYIYDKETNEKEQSFDLVLRTYGKDLKDMYKSNVLKFLDEIFPKLKHTVTVESRYSSKFPAMTVKPLKYQSEEYGLSYLFYEVDTGNWYAGTLVYGSWDVHKKFLNFDEAFEAAYNSCNIDDT